MSITKSIAIMGAPFLSIIFSLGDFFTGLFIVVLLDLITGISKYFVENKIKFGFNKKTFYGIKSDLIRKTLMKVFEYFMFISSAIIIQHLIYDGDVITLNTKGFSITELALSITILVEIWSIFENVEKITNRNLLKVAADIISKKPDLSTISKEVSDEEE